MLQIANPAVGDLVRAVRGRTAEVVAFEFQDPLTIEPSPVAPEALRAGIAPVPVPAAAWLFAPAAALLGLRRRRGLTAQDNP